MNGKNVFQLFYTNYYVNFSSVLNEQYLLVYWLVRYPVRQLGVILSTLSLNFYNFALLISSKVFHIPMKMLSLTFIFIIVSFSNQCMGPFGTL